MQATFPFWTFPTFALAQPGQSSPDAATQALVGPSAGGAPPSTGTATTGAPSTATQTTQTQPGIPPMLLIAIPLILVMLLGPALAGRKEKKKRAALLASVKKHDRVQTIGGMIGIVSDVRDDEIVLKVDESSNTKIRFARSAIQQVLKTADTPAPAQPVAEVQTKPRSERAAV